MSTRKGPVFSMKKRINPDIVLSVAAVALICFTLGFFLGRNSLSPAKSVTVETAKQTQPEKVAEPETQEPETQESETQESETEDPAEPETPEVPEVPEVPENSGGLLNINTATAAELETLPGIGEVLAQRIVDYRTEHGPFSSADGLLEVSGIGDKKLEAIESLITVR